MNVPLSTLTFLFWAESSLREDCVWFMSMPQCMSLGLGQITPLSPSMPDPRPKTQEELRTQWLSCMNDRPPSGRTESPEAAMPTPISSMPIQETPAASPPLPCRPLGHQGLDFCYGYTPGNGVFYFLCTFQALRLPRSCGIKSSPLAGWAGGLQPILQNRKTEAGPERLRRGWSHTLR